MTRDEQEITARFAAQMLDGELAPADEEPEEGSGLHHLDELLAAVQRGEITHDEAVQRQSAWLKGFERGRIQAARERSARP